MQADLDRHNGQIFRSRAGASAMDGRARRRRVALRRRVRPLIGAIDVNLMRQANLRATGGGKDSSPAVVVRWMLEKIGARAGK